MGFISLIDPTHKASEANTIPENANSVHTTSSNLSALTNKYENWATTGSQQFEQLSAMGLATSRLGKALEAELHIHQDFLRQLAKPSAAIEKNIHIASDIQRQHSLPKEQRKLTRAGSELAKQSKKIAKKTETKLTGPQLKDQTYSHIHAQIQTEFRAALQQLKTTSAPLNNAIRTHADALEHYEKAHARNIETYIQVQSCDLPNYIDGVKSPYDNLSAGILKNAQQEYKDSIETLQNACAVLKDAKTNLEIAWIAEKQKLEPLIK